MLELYQAEDCPNCEKVRETLMKLGVSYVAHNPRTAGGDIRNAQTLEELKEIGGDDQVPFLVDHDRREQRYESDDIVAYLQEHYR
jgi:glutathione S-transferase